ncbi:hypothetical protein J7L01_03020 [bacterium]|nr:hypothetical protein [bacterium]
MRFGKNLHDFARDSRASGHPSVETDGNKKGVSASSTTDPLPELVEGPFPELVEGPFPELVEGPFPELAEGPFPELAEGPFPELAEGENKKRVASGRPSESSVKGKRLS